MGSRMTEPGRLYAGNPGLKRGSGARKLANLRALLHSRYRDSGNRKPAQLLTQWSLNGPLGRVGGETPSDAQLLETRHLQAVRDAAEWSRTITSR